ncbi:hypothetical protein BH09SUM1_BH09SUM1_17120 [soil metagenome]
MVKRRTFLFDGLGVSSGVVLGPAHLLETQGLQVDAHDLSPEES